MAKTEDSIQVHIKEVIQAEIASWEQSLHFLISSLKLKAEEIAQEELSPLKIEYQSAYQTRSGILILKLTGLNATLKYKF